MSDSLRSAGLIGPWLAEMRSFAGPFAELLRASESGLADGFGHTIREICQQPPSWVETARRLADYRDVMGESLGSCRRVVITGSGSSQYAAECAAPALARELGIPVEVIGGGDLLLRHEWRPSSEPVLVVSLARSGNSPESVAAVENLIENQPRTRHLVITCSAEGNLARKFVGNSRVRVVQLDTQVNDASLVMTSSFTNLALAVRFLGWLNRTAAFVELAEELDRAGRRLLAGWPDRLAGLVSGDLRRAVFLGHGTRFGVCREAALKLLEMTCGRVAAMAETYLGLRHGPMAFIDPHTLVVCFLSADPLVRPYEIDLIAELRSKGLGARSLIAGPQSSAAALSGGPDVLIDYATPPQIGDDELPLLDAMIAQILGFHRCREEGLKPDSPSAENVITRVVPDFPLYRPVKETAVGEE